MARIVGRQACKYIHLSLYTGADPPRKDSRSVDGRTCSQPRHWMKLRSRHYRLTDTSGLPLQIPADFVWVRRPAHPKIICHNDSTRIHRFWAPVQGSDILCRRIRHWGLARRLRHREPSSATLQVRGIVVGLGLSSLLIESQLSIKYLARHVVALAASGRSTAQPLVFLEAHCPPLFENASSSALGDHTARLPSPTGHGEMPPVMRCICLTFTTHQDQEDSIRSCKDLHLPRCVAVHTRIVRKNLYHKDNLRLLENFCRLLCFDLAFEVQKSFSSGLLDPLELCVALKAQILQLQQQSYTMPS